MTPPRRGSVLIIVAGLCALLASLVLSLLMVSRSDREESVLLRQDIQARLMLYAGLNYIQEAARLGWGEETFGWTDIRDGKPGPRVFDGTIARNQSGNLVFDDAETGQSSGGGFFPAIGGRAARSPMHPLMRPPSAIMPAQVTNPIPVTSLASGGDSSYWATQISYNKPGTIPAVPNFADWRKGDLRPDMRGEGQAWFRLYRPTPADLAAVKGINPAISANIHWSPSVFFLTCGAGATRGFKNYAEAQAAGMTDIFGNDPALFAQLRAQERILWYACEWHPGQASASFQHYGNPGGERHHSMTWHAVQHPTIEGLTQRGQTRLFGGTFLWIQRLNPRGENEPW